MQPIPFWKLPFLARKNVFHQMNPNDVFNLSMTSTKSKLFIMAFHKLPPANFSWHIGSGTSNLNISFARPWGDRITVYIGAFREGESLKDPSLRNVNRTHILMSQDSGDRFIVCEKDKKRTFDEKMNVMEMISRHLLDIVNAESYDLRYSYHHDLPMKKFTKCFVFDITKKFRRVEINNWCEKLKAPEFDFLMNEIEVDQMDMSVNARVKGVFTHPKIVFYQHSTVSFDNIFNLKSVRFEAQMHRLIKPEELVRLLVAWADGEKLQNLKWMRIFHGFGSYKKNLIGRVTKRMQEMEGDVSFEILEIEQDDRDEDDHEDQDEDQEVEEDVADEQDEDVSDEEQEDVEMSDEEVSNGENVEEGTEQNQILEIVDQSGKEIEQDNPEEVADERNSCDIEAEEEQEMVDENDGVAGSDENDDENDDEDHDENDEEDHDEDHDEDHNEDEAVSDGQDEEQDGDDEDDKESDSESDSEEEEESDEEDDEDNNDISEIRLQRKIDGKVLRLLYGYTSSEIEVFSENDFFSIIYWNRD